MTSDIIQGVDPIEYEKKRLKEMTKRINDLFPAKHKFTFPHLDRWEAHKLNKNYK